MEKDQNLNIPLLLRTPPHRFISAEADPPFRFILIYHGLSPIIEERPPNLSKSILDGQQLRRPRKHLQRTGTKKQ